MGYWMKITNKRLQWILYLHVECKILHYEDTFITGILLLVFAVDLQTPHSTRTLIIMIYVI